MAKTMIHRFIKIVFLLLIYFIVFSLTGELYVRIFDKYKAMDEMDMKKYRAPSDILHHTFVPKGKGRNYTKEFRTIYRINSFGIRDREYALNKEEGVFRIIVLGDSFTEGYGVNIEDTFIKKLEWLLNSDETAKDNKYEVLNFGCAGYSPLLEYILLKQKGMKFDPDLVILMLDYSDFYDDIRYSEFSKSDNKGKPISVLNSELSIADSRLKSSNIIDAFLLRHSVFYNYLRLKIQKIIWGGGDGKNIHPVAIKSGDIKSDRFWMLKDKIYMYDRDFEKYSIVENTAENRAKAADLTFKYLTMIKDMLEENNKEFLLVIFPYGQQVDANDWSEGRVLLGLERGKTYNDFYLYEKTLGDFTEKAGINTMNLYPYFIKNNAKPLFFKIDGHFNKNGHDLVAQALYEYIMNNF